MSGCLRQLVEFKSRRFTPTTDTPRRAPAATVHRAGVVLHQARYARCQLLASSSIQVRRELSDTFVTKSNFLFDEKEKSEDEVDEFAKNRPKIGAASINIAEECYCRTTSVV